jgi:hypothetical protein
MIKEMEIEKKKTNFNSLLKRRSNKQSMNIDPRKMDIFGS